MANRHAAREMAFQLVYQWLLNEGSLHDEKRSQEYWKERTKESLDNWPFFQRVLKGVAHFLPQIDARIEHTLENWKLSRVDKVDLAILRLGTFELLYDTDADRPDEAVIIDEAIELAKRFGGKESPSFINGILDKISKSTNDRL